MRKNAAMIRRIAAILLVSALVFLFSGCYLNQVETLQEINANQEQRIVELREQVNRKTNDYLDLKRESNQTIESLRQDLSKAQSQAREALQERSTREEQLIQTNAVLRRNLQDMTEERDYYSQLSESLKKKSEQLENNVNNLQAQVNQLSQDKAALDRRLNQAQNNLDDEKKETQTLQTKLNETETALKEAREKLQGGESSLARTMEELEKARAENERLEKALAEARENGGTSAAAGAIDQQLQDAYVLFESSLKSLNLIEDGKARVVKDERGVVIQISADYLFLRGSLKLDPAVYPLLDQIARAMKRYPDKYVEIQGHTDSQPVVNLPFADNWGLAAERAGKVVRYLEEEGQIKPGRLKSVSCSQYRPISDQEGVPASMNRRVDIILTSIP
ncbi:MAG: OmpA family protein [Candidatus Sumerlaeia bacterium]